MTLTHVRDLMSTELITLDVNHDFRSVTDMIKLKRLRHLPVVDRGKLIGLVTQRDLLRAQAKLMIELAKPATDGSDERVVTVRVQDFMTTKELITCGPAVPADDAARLMLERKLGCILVVDDDQLVGIVTEADLVKWAVEMMAKRRLEQGGGTLSA